MEHAATAKVAPSPSAPALVDRMPTPATHRHASARVLLLLFVAWALVVPIKNVVLITFPDIRQDSVETEHSAYAFTRATAASGPVVVRGEDILPLLRRVADLALAKPAVFDSLNAAETFSIDAIHDYLSVDEFHALSLYYGLLFQASELPGFSLTPRPRRTLAEWTSDAPGMMRVYVRPDGATTAANDVLLRVSCLADNARLQGARCWLPGTTRRCNDFFDGSKTLNFTMVDLDPLRGNATAASGLSNNAGLLSLVTVFHTQMIALFGAKSWRAVVANAGMDASDEYALKQGLASVFRDGVPVISSSRVALIGLNGARTTTFVESCVAAELTTSMFYSTAVVLATIQDALRAANVYNPYEFNYSLPASTMAMLAPMLAFNVSLTTGARPQPRQRNSLQLFNRELTSVTAAAMAFKLDKDFSSAVDALGSSVRMLLYMSFYPNVYSYRRHTVRFLSAANGSAVPYDEDEMRLIGAAYSGYNTFKPDSWWQCTMMNYRLAEVPRDATDSVQDPWWDDEAHYAAWFAALEKSADAPFLLLNDYISLRTIDTLTVSNDVRETRCHRAMYKVLTKIAWLALNTVSRLPEYLVFQSAAEAGGKDYFLKQMRTLQLVGEGITGKRIYFPYTIDATDRLDDGSAWVSLYILDALLATLGKAAALTAFETTYLETFSTFLNKESTVIHFPDAGHCTVTPQPAYLNASITDLMEPLRYKKGVMAFMATLLDRVPALLARLKTELAPQRLAAADIPPEIILGTDEVDRQLRWAGSPVPWHATPLTVGLLKLLPAYTPPTTVVHAYRNATRCYRTLELRYLNESVRCFVEPTNTHKTRVAYDADMLRKLLFSTWAISLVLNLMAAIIALEYATKLARAFRVTRFADVDTSVAMGLSFGASGVLSLGQTFQMAISALPLLVTYHLPPDEVFLPTLQDSQWPKLVQDAVVVGCMIWFFKLSYDLANKCMHLSVVSLWFNNLWLRAGACAVVFLARAATRESSPANVDYPWWRLLLTIIGTLVLGVLDACVPLVMQWRHLAGKRPLTKAEADMDSNAVVQALRRREAPLNEFGLLGYSTSAAYWSLTGLLVEGWEIVEDDNKTTSLRKHKYVIPLERDRQGKPMCRILRQDKLQGPRSTATT